MTLQEIAQAAVVAIPFVLVFACLSISATGSAVWAVAARIEHINQRLEELGQRVEGLGQTLGELEGHFDGPGLDDLEEGCLPEGLPGPLGPNVAESLCLIAKELQREEPRRVQLS